MHSPGNSSVQGIVASRKSEATSGLYVLLLASVAALGGFLFGFDSGVINGTVDALERTFASGAIGTGFSVASILLGCAAGAFFAGALADRFGRKPVMLMTAIVFALSSFGAGLANTASFFIAARILGGLAIGAASVIAPTYIAEIAPAHLRGRLASLQQLAIVIGLFAAFVSNYSLANWAGSASAPLFLGLAAWRWMFWVGALPALAFLLGSLSIPESPRYLVAQGLDDEAAKVFAATLRGDARAKVREVRESLRGGGKPRLRDLLDPQTRRVVPAVWIGIGLATFQQFVGINVIFYYGSVLWQAAGFSEGEALWTNVITGAANTLSTFVAIALIDRLGRRPLLLIGSLGMALSLGGMALIFARGGLGSEGQLQLDTGSATTALWLANFYIFFFAASWGPVVWVLLGEMFSNRVRGAAMAAAVALHWIANFSVTMTFPVLLRILGLAAAYGIYASAAFISFFFVLRWVRETKGTQLEEMR